MATTADLRVGAVIKHQGDLCVVMESQHRTPGNLRAFVQVVMRQFYWRGDQLVESVNELVELVRVERDKYLPICRLPLCEYCYG